MAVALRRKSLVKAAESATRKPLPAQLAAAEAKANFLKMLSSIDEAGEYVITKRGRPVARLVPYAAHDQPSVFGCMKGTARIVGDVISPLPPDEWAGLL